MSNTGPGYRRFRDFVGAPGLRRVAAGLTAIVLCQAMPASAIPMSSILTQYSPYDHDGDGTNEIEALRPLAGVQRDVNAIVPDRPYVLVIVEPRLLNEIPGSTHSVQDLKSRLLRWKGDLSAEGLTSVFIEADVYRGTVHQDGRTVLALRAFIRAARASYPRLDGVMLVGHFPEATIIHKFLWKAQWPVKIRDIDVGDHPILFIDSRIEAARTDIVLADLDGDWDGRYIQPRTRVENLLVDPLPSWGSDWPQSRTYTATLWEINPWRYPNVYEDFFLIDDAQYTTSVSPDGGTLTLGVDTRFRDAEVSAVDRTRPTAMAMPDIYVSRINPYSVAFQEDPNYHDATGQGLYDASGAPRILTADASNGPPIRHDPNLERTLLIEHFGHNHAFRTGAYADTFRAGALATREWNPDHYGRQLMSARDDWWYGPFNVPNADMADYASWLRQSLTLRSVMAHANCCGTEFPRTNLDEIAAAAGPMHGWWYKPDRGQWEPTWEFVPGWAGFKFFWSLWRNQKIGPRVTPAFTIHGGCEVNTPLDQGTTAPYTAYGYGQNAESQLFLGKGVGVMARSKIFYDDPNGWQDDFRANPNARFGDMLTKFYEDWSAEPFANKRDRAAIKRTYWWGQLGDYTLRLRYTGGLTLMSTHPSTVDGPRALSEGASVEGMTYSSATTSVSVAGNFRAGGADEFFMTDTAGNIALAYFDGDRYRLEMKKPADTWFDGWFHNAQVTLLGAGNLDGVGRDDILVRGPSGVAALTYDANARTLRALTVVPWGGRWGATAGAWTLDRWDNFHLADLDGDGATEIVVTNMQGIGVLRVRPQGGATTLVNRPEGTLFGAWRYSSLTTTIAGFGNFDADPGKEMVVQGDQGMAILDYVALGRTFASPFLAPHGASFGDWTFGSRDQILVIGNFVGDRRDDMLVRSESALGLWKIANGGPIGVLRVENGTAWTGANTGVTWPAAASDRVEAVGDFDGDGRDEFVLGGTRGWGYARLFGSTIEIERIHHMNRADRGWILGPYDVATVVADLDPRVPGKDMLVRRGMR